MKIKSIHQILMIFFFLLPFGCEKTSYWKIQSSDQEFLIVDGIITNENINHTILLSLSSSEANQIAPPASGAVVTVFDGQDTVHFIEDPENMGSYISDQSFIAVVNRIYKLDILYKNKHYSAHTGMLPVSPASHLSYSFNEDSDLYFINSETAILNIEEAAMFEVLTDWSHIPEYTSLITDSTSAMQYYYTLTTLDVNQIFSPAREIIYFPLGSKIVQKKYSMTPEHEKFIRSVLIETQWSGGYFDVEEGNVYTNLSEGALGFFGACSVISDTLIVE